MRVNHRRGNVAVPKQLLNRTNILPIFQQVSRETVPERMATGRFGHACLVDRSLDRVLKILFRNVMPARFARPRIHGKFAAGKTYCHGHDLFAFGYFRSRANGR